MDAIIWMAIGAAIVVGLLVAKFGAAKVWSYVQDWLKARAAKAEADFEAKVKAAVDKSKAP
jgi:hypothetical protein